MFPKKQFHKKKHFCRFALRYSLIRVIVAEMYELERELREFNYVVKSEMVILICGRF